MTRPLHVRPAGPGDRPRLQAIRAAAFAPVLAGFRAAVGPELAAVAFAAAEAEQAALLDSLLDAGSDHRVLVAGRGPAPEGFCSLRADRATGLGEIGLTAVAPSAQGQGIGRALVAAALEALRADGMRAACVGTGGDAAHTAARRLYAAAGFAAAIPAVHLYRPL